MNKIRKSLKQMTVGPGQYKYCSLTKVFDKEDFSFKLSG